VSSYLCDQSGCEEEAAWTYVWPGRGHMRICEKHRPKLLATADALGLPAASLDLKFLVPAPDTEPVLPEDPS